MDAVVLSALKELGYVTNESPFTGRTSTSAYWLTEAGRQRAETLRMREVEAKVEAATNGEAF